MKTATMGPFELVDRIVNGPPAPPPEPTVIRVRLTPEQLRRVEAGEVLDFRAGRVTVMVCRATGTAEAQQPPIGMTRPRKGTGRRK